LWCTGGVNRKLRESKRHRVHLKIEQTISYYFFFKNWIRKREKFFRIWSGPRSLAVEKRIGHNAVNISHRNVMIGQGPSFIPKLFGFQSLTYFLPILIFSNYDPNEMERNAGPRTSICSVIF
jgi:hypothetical protein